MRIMPGFSRPSLPPPPPPVPTVDTAAKEREAARLKQRQAEAQRRGRASTILSDELDDSGGLGKVNRPSAGGAGRSARLLG